MFKLDTEDALLAAFRPKDRQLVELAPDVKLPMVVRSYVAWTHPAGGRVYLVFATPGGVPTGIVFDTDGLGPSVPHMCDWCHSTGSGAQAALLTAYVNSKKRAGVHVCADLSCKQKLEEEADRSGRSVQPMMEKVLARMGQFASDALGIELSGANR